MSDLFNGVLLIDKKRGCTSHDVVAELRKALKQKAIGHAGTLDPSAEGLLVILLGQATKLSSYILNNDKRYYLTIKFGLVTDTFDTEGKILKDIPVSLEEKEIRKVLQDHLGVQKIHVPSFSAVKVQGKKLYAYARAQQAVQLPIKEMSFFDLNVEDIQKDQVTVEVSCTKGSYIRSWVDVIGKAVGTGACLTHLRRTLSKPFCLSDSLTAEDFKEKVLKVFPKGEQDLKSQFGKSFLFCSEALPQFPVMELTSRDSRFVSQGRIPEFLIQHTLEQQKEVNQTQKNQIMKITVGTQLVSLLEFSPFQKLRILKNFNQSRKRV